MIVSFSLATSAIGIYPEGVWVRVSNATTRKQINILMAEDSTDDRMLMKQALQASHLCWHLHMVEDGEQLLDYLYHRHDYKDLTKAPRPELILLDVYLPKLNGMEALQVIKADPTLRRIPIVMMTASKSENDIRRCYELGASSYLTKPMTFELLLEAVNTLGQYWFDIVELPPDNIHER
jgi:CheY-like chemotaxis protein